MAQPTTRTGRTASGSLLLALAVVVVACNLRPAITSVGPVLDQTRTAYAASAGWVGLLTTVPVLCLAAAGALAPRLARRVGLRGAIAVALVAVTAGLVVRVLGGPALMIAATVIATSGVAIAGVLVPVVVRAGFPARIGLVTGLYTAALQAGATLGFALTPLLATGLGGWRPALASWATLGALALAGWAAWGRPAAASARAAVPGSAEPESRPSLLRSPLAWTVTAFFGLQAFVAFAVMNWLPLALMDRGVERTEAGLLLGILSIVALPVSLLVPPLAGRARGQGGWILALSACGAAGLLGFLLVPTTGPWQALPWVLLLGLGMSVFSLALTVIALRAPSAARTADLSGMAQGIGYVIAGTGPFVVGLLHESTGGWTAPFAVLLAVVVAQAVTGALAGRPRTL
ncbi:MFS transporter [Pseudonocardia zijingensis]|uniref:MFS transporter n=1 Tax=Pseudonocardia zijingensis TaxID=153376 RepID=A0ABP3YPJ2_9PSEU